MKKLPLFCTLCFVFCTSSVFAYTQTDIANAQFLADKGIIVKQSTTAGYRLDNTITRAEVVGIALKLKGVALPSYQCKGYFSDVTANDWVCRAVEIGADHGLVSRANAKFRPSDTITRAEALSIVMQAGKIEILNCDNCDTKTADSTASWQNNIFISAYLEDIVYPEDFTERGHIYRPNNKATRAEFFKFSTNTLLAHNSVQQINNTYSIDLVSGPYNDDIKILYLKTGDKRTVIDRKVRKILFIIGNYVIYESERAGHATSKIFSLKNLEIVSSVPSEKISDDKKYVFGCDSIRCVIFSLEKGKEVYHLQGESSFDTTSTYLGKNIFELSNGRTGETIKIDVSETVKRGVEGILENYYWLISQGSLKSAYAMRSPSGMSYEKFESLYKNISKTISRDTGKGVIYYNHIEVWKNSIKDLGNNTYEFTVRISENGATTDYTVKSKVNIENFTINNISSVKQ